MVLFVCEKLVLGFGEASIFQHQRLFANKITTNTNNYFVLHGKAISDSLSKTISMPKY
jgi:hypothetical protein